MGVSRMVKKWCVLPSAIMLFLLLTGCGGNQSANPTAQPTSAPISESLVTESTVEPTAQGSLSTESSATAGGPDADGDGLPDAPEILLSTDPNNPDTDGDGQNDREDKQPTFTDNPISETTTTQGFRINSILVENNVGANNRAVSDHLELSITNITNTTLTNFDVYYIFT